MATIKFTYVNGVFTVKKEAEKFSVELKKMHDKFAVTLERPQILHPVGEEEPAHDHNDTTELWFTLGVFFTAFLAFVLGFLMVNSNSFRRFLGRLFGCDKVPAKRRHGQSRLLYWWAFGLCFIAAAAIVKFGDVWRDGVRRNAKTTAETVIKHLQANLRNRFTIYAHSQGVLVIKAMLELKVAEGGLNHEQKKRLHVIPFGGADEIRELEPAACGLGYLAHDLTMDNDPIARGSQVWYSYRNTPRDPAQPTVLQAVAASQKAVHFSDAYFEWARFQDAAQTSFTQHAKALDVL